MGSHRDNLLRSIADTVADYRKGEVDPITPSHVDRWVKQFEREDQMVILIEMDQILKRFYFSRGRVKKCYQNFLEKEVVGIESGIICKIVEMKAACPLW
jgi:hypothetical protein